MSSTAADNLCERLVEWDANTIYGFPGDGINGVLGALRRHQVTWEQRVMEGDPKFVASQVIPYLDYAAYAELIGLRGIKVTEAAEIEEAWRQALSADRPVIISALTDPNEAPLPPHITFEQAKGFAKSVAADPGEGLPAAVQSIREKTHEFLPGR